MAFLRYLDGAGTWKLRPYKELQTVPALSISKEVFRQKNLKRSENVFFLQNLHEREILTKVASVVCFFDMVRNEF